MLCKLKNLLPDDTRIVELTSAIAIIVSCLLVYFGIAPSHETIQYWQVWFGVAFVAALSQFGSLVIFDKMDKLRVVSSLIVGGLLIYLGIVHTDVSIFSQVTQVTLGIANLYSFLINNQRLVWI